MLYKIYGGFAFWQHIKSMFFFSAHTSAMEESVLHRRRNLYFLRDLLQHIRVWQKTGLGQPSWGRGDSEESCRQEGGKTREKNGEESKSGGDRAITVCTKFRTRYKHNLKNITFFYLWSTQIKIKLLSMVRDRIVYNFTALLNSKMGFYFNPIKTILYFSPLYLGEQNKINSNPLSHFRVLLD